jgi:hypothetical protein
LETKEGFERAAKLEPGNPRNWYLLGRFLQYNLELQDTPGAIGAYQRALAIDPNSAETLLELGSAYELDGDFAPARTAYARAKSVYPASADVSWRYGNFLLRQGDFPAAYFEIHRALLADPKNAAEAFSRCYRANPDADFILKEVIPPSQIAYVAIIRETAGTHLDIAEKAWAKLAGLRPYLNPRDVYPLVDAMLRAQKYPEARRVWNEGMSFTDAGAAIADASALIWDGGFESGLNGRDFAWQFEALHDGVQTRFDLREKHSGQRSLRMDFDGKHNVRLENICTAAVVQPGETYLLSGWIRTDKLTSDQGVGLRIGAGMLSARTESLLGNQPWMRVEVPWTADSQTRIAPICVYRDPSERTEGRISGTAWIDDITLSPTARERTQP